MQSFFWQRSICFHWKSMQRSRFCLNGRVLCIIDREIFFSDHLCLLRHSNWLNFPRIMHNMCQFLRYDQWDCKTRITMIDEPPWVVSFGHWISGRYFEVFWFCLVDMTDSVNVRRGGKKQVPCVIWSFMGFSIVVI